MNSDKKLALINGWKVVTPPKNVVEHRQTGFTFGNKVEVIVYVNGKRTDTMILPKSCVLNNY